jgi:outer membrane protein OmpA-like peptidoglycan-associated protein
MKARAHQMHEFGERAGSARWRWRTLFAVGAGTLLAAGAVVTACVNAPVHPSAALPGYSFDYAVQNREPTGLIQVFDDGRRTYLQFSDWTGGSPSILDAQGDVIPFERAGAYAVIAGRHDRLLVNVRGAQTVVNAGSIVYGRGIAAAAVTPAAPAAADIQAKEAEVGNLRVRVAALEVGLAQARATLLAFADNLVIHFGNNSARISVGHDTLQAIAEVVRGQDAIVVTGYTDATYPDAAGEDLARRRAQNVRRALVNEGIPKKTVNITYHAAGMFAVENGSREGKALNRRVEIIANKGASNPSG